MTRASNRHGLPPTGVTTRPSIARRILPCIAAGISPISSRKSVPSPASRNAPARSAVAPVKEPLMCPKSSLSSKSAGIAAQLTATKGFALRRPCSCRARATSSLPVPVSPRIKTVASLSAARPIVFCTRRIASLEPMSWLVSPISSAAGGLPRRRGRRFRRASSSWRPIGLVR